MFLLLTLTSYLLTLLHVKASTSTYNTSNIISTVETNNTGWAVTNHPTSLINLKWKSEATRLSITITRVPSDVILLGIEAKIDDVGVAKIQAVDTAYRLGDIALPRESNFSQKDLNHTFLFTVQPTMLGRAKLTILAVHQSASLNNQTSREVLKRLEISVVRVERIVDKVFQYSVYLLLVIVTFSMGAEINLQTVKKSLRVPKAPAIALSCQFVIMPLLAYGIARLAGYEGGTALGFFSMGCAPGGGPSNMYSHLLGGDLSVSVTLTFLSTVLSIGMLPLWLFTLGRTFPQGAGQAKIPFVIILQTIAVLTVPLAIGILIQYKLPKVRDVLRKSLKVLMIAIVTLLFTSGIITNLYIFEMFDPLLILVGASLPYGGFILGGCIALIFKMEWKLIKTIAIETGLQNAGVPFFMIQRAFVSPDLELATAPVVSAIIMTPVPLLIASFIYTVYIRCQDKSSEEQGVPCPSLDVTYLEDSISEDQKKTNLELLAPVRDELPANKDSISHSSYNEKLRMLPAA